MRIAMFTNTYLPQVGGVANSVDRFVSGYRRRGHRGLVVAPEYEDQPQEETDVFRVPAIQQFNGSDFSVALPIGVDLREALDRFAPQVIHSHHPFLLGVPAVRAAAHRNLPLVFTYHTMYEHYTHYVPLQLKAMRSFVIRLSSGYADLCDRIIAPSESVAQILRSRGVSPPIEVIPTGVDLDRFAEGDGRGARERLGIPADAILLGHVGRLAHEKNLPFLAEAAARVLADNEKAWMLVVGHGDAEEAMRQTFQEAGVADRVVFAGVLREQALVDTYHAMDCFLFASRTETQGMVLVEALSTGCPVVALDAAGAREVVQDGENGSLLIEQDHRAFAQAVGQLIGQSPEARCRMRERARRSARPFDTSICVDKTLDLYEQVIADERRPIDPEHSTWKSMMHSIHKEWEVWSNRLASVSKAISNE